MDALQYGFEQVRSSELLTNRVILEMQAMIEENSAVLPNLRFYAQGRMR